MKKTIVLTFVFLVGICSVKAQKCTDIDTKEIAAFLNKNIKPRFDLKLDKDDGFLSILGNRQNFSVPSVSVSPVSRRWTYHFENVRRKNSNFFYDSRKNLFVLDVIFEDNGPELKGLCPGCLRRFRDSRAPDVNWGNPSILRIYLNPKVYQNSISFSISDITLFGNFSARGLGKIIPNLTGEIVSKLKSELVTLFQNGQTQRLLSDALKPLFNKYKISEIRSVSLASTSLRACK